MDISLFVHDDLSRMKDYLVESCLALQVKITHTKTGQQPNVVYSSGASSAAHLTAKTTQSQIHFSANTPTNQSTVRFSTDGQPGVQISHDNQSQSPRVTLDANHQSIKFSLTSQPGSISMTAAVSQGTLRDLEYLLCL